jgi:lipoprotein-anchoring transpeptidase ErfK/SrfK
VVLPGFDARRTRSARAARPSRSLGQRALIWHSCLTVLALTSGCSERQDPPASNQRARSISVGDGAQVPEQGGDRPIATAGSSTAMGQTDDSLPFTPTGLKIASTAWRTWVYTDTGPTRTRFGYLRVGAIVDARGPAIKNEGCEPGWYRVNPRGFVCIGKGASLTIDEAIVQQAAVRPKRGAGLPYIYAMATGTPPNFYFSLPSREHLLHLEGSDRRSSFATWKLANYDSRPAVAELLGAPGEPPSFLRDGGRAIKPYGVLHRVEEKVSSGRAAPDSGFALLSVFEHGQRWYGMTTEHDLVALDRVKIIVPSAFHGLELPTDNGGCSVGFADKGSVPLFRMQPDGSMAPDGALERRQGVALTGERKPGGYLLTPDGRYVPSAGLRLIPKRTEFPSFATGDRKWIDVSILKQSLVAYVGKMPVYATLVSSGRGLLGDPETESATPRGTFMVYSKHVSATMDGADDASDSYSLLDVPFVQYFHKGFALHGTYWHDEFGRVRSHGCINLAPRDAAWLFEWTDPPVPDHWHGVINKERGTVVYVHA